jgi:hypothetical protein
MTNLSNQVIDDLSDSLLLSNLDELSPIDICTCPTHLFKNATGQCWMDTILSILLFSDGLREIIIPQINDYRDKQYDPTDPNNIFIPFNIDPSNIYRFINVCNAFIKNLKNRLDINQHQKQVSLPTLTREKSGKQSEKCDTSLQDIFNINRNSEKRSGSGGDYSTYLIVIALFNYLFMRHDQYYIDIINYKFNKTVKLDDDNTIDPNIIRNCNGMIVGISTYKIIDGTYNGNHAVGIFECGNKLLYYDDNFQNDLLNVGDICQLSDIIRLMKNINKTRNYIYSQKAEIIQLDVIRLNRKKFEIEEYKKQINISILLSDHNANYVINLFCNENKLITNEFGYTPLQKFIILINNVEIHRITPDKYIDYIKKSIDPEKKVLTMQDNEGNTPLHYALLNPKNLTIEIIKELIIKETLNIRNNDRLTPIKIIIGKINKIKHVTEDTEKYIKLKKYMHLIASNKKQQKITVAPSVAISTSNIISNAAKKQQKRKDVSDDNSSNDSSSDTSSSGTSSSDAKRYKTDPDEISKADPNEISKAEPDEISKADPDGGNNKYKLICFHHCY